jgi:hypothetical protein
MDSDFVSLLEGAETVRRTDVSPSADLISISSMSSAVTEANAFPSTPDAPPARHSITVPWVMNAVGDPLFRMSAPVTASVSSG